MLIVVMLELLLGAGLVSAAVFLPESSRPWVWQGIALGLVWMRSAFQRLALEALEEQLERQRRRLERCEEQVDRAQAVNCMRRF